MKTLPHRLLHHALSGLLIMFTAVCAAQQPAPSVETQQSPDGPTYTLRVNAREVLLEVIARDQHNRPISDLQQADLHVFELADNQQQRPRRITVFGLVQPSPSASLTQTSTSAFHVALTGGCATRNTAHYRIAFQPSGEGWNSGYHHILVTTDRPGITLIYRHTYYVGRTDPLPPEQKPNDTLAQQELKNIACYHGGPPASIGLKGAMVENPQPALASGMVQYSLVIQPDSLDFSSIAETGHRVALDYAICAFNRDGNAIQYIRHPTVKKLTDAQYAKVLTDGFANPLTFPLPPESVWLRLVVRDQSTQNVGIIELNPSHQADLSRVARKDTGDLGFKVINGRTLPVQQRDMGTFGTILAQPSSFCGDVYEIQPGTPRIITNFGEQDAVGTIYTPVLNVPKQTMIGGIPGATANEEWFDIDYYGDFWLPTAGKYRFRLVSDDGAKLYIDDAQIIEQDGIHPSVATEASVKLTAGHHTIHVPYFQGPAVVGLSLEMQPPGLPMQTMDLRKLQAPPEHAEESASSGTIQPPR